MLYTLLPLILSTTLSAFYRLGNWLQGIKFPAHYRVGQLPWFTEDGRTFSGCGDFSVVNGNMLDELKKTTTAWQGGRHKTISELSANWSHSCPKVQVWIYLRKKKKFTCGYVIKVPSLRISLIVTLFLSSVSGYHWITNPAWRFRVYEIRFSVFVHSQLSSYIN